jgi:UrcA family protein
LKHLASLALALSLAAPIAAPVAAHAATAGDQSYATRVSFADLGLSRPTDARVMVNRLDRAALSACGASTFSARQVQDEARASTCYRESMDRAVASLASPAVDAAYHARLQRLGLN